MTWPDIHDLTWGDRKLDQLREALAAGVDITVRAHQRKFARFDDAKIGRQITS